MSVPARFGFHPRERRERNFRHHHADLAGFEELLRRDRREQVQEASYDSRPTGLVARSQAGPVVSVEVLVEEDEVLEVRIVLELPGAPIHRPPAALVAKEDAREPPRELLGDL